jgi:hypothetical protein
VTNTTVSCELSRVLNLAIEKKYPDRHHCRDRVILELVTSLVSTHNMDLLGAVDLTMQRLEEQANEVVAMDSIWRAVEDVLDSADSAVTRFPDDGQKIKRWSHQSPLTIDGKYDVDMSASMDELSACAATYINRDWAKSPTLELWLVRQMIYAETISYGREAEIPVQNKSFKFWWMWTKSLVKWLIGLAVAVSVGELHGLALGVLTYVLWLAVTRYLAQDQIDRLTHLGTAFSNMRSSYTISLRNFVCPVEIEKSLSLAETHGAVWPVGLRSLVELAVARNRVVWI